MTKEFEKLSVVYQKKFEKTLSKLVPQIVSTRGQAWTGDGQHIYNNLSTNRFQNISKLTKNMEERIESEKKNVFKGEEKMKQ